jgi:hypothetical protein
VVGVAVAVAVAGAGRSLREQAIRMKANVAKKSTRDKRTSVAV